MYLVPVLCSMFFLILSVYYICSHGSFLELFGKEPWRKHDILKVSGLNDSLAFIPAKFWKTIKEASEKEVPMFSEYPDVGIKMFEIKENDSTIFIGVGKDPNLFKELKHAKGVWKKAKRENRLSNAIAELEKKEEADYKYLKFEVLSKSLEKSITVIKYRYADVGEDSKIYDVVISCVVPNGDYLITRIKSSEMINLEVVDAIAKYNKVHA